MGRRSGRMHLAPGRRRPAGSVLRQRTGRPRPGSGFGFDHAPALAFSFFYDHRARGLAGVGDFEEIDFGEVQARANRELPGPALHGAFDPVRRDHRGGDDFKRAALQTGGVFSPAFAITAPAAESRLDTPGQRCECWRMFARSCLIVLAAVAGCAIAQEPPPATAALTAVEIQGAAVSESISLPGPGELFAAIGKIGKPDWSAMFRKPPSGVFTRRPQLALNLGTLLADGHLAVEAQEKQEVKNISREIRNLAKALGLEQEVANRINSVSDFADGRRWDALSEELDAIRGELATAMNGRHDSDLVTLMTLGAWLRGIEVASGHVAENYTPEGAKALRQPALCGFFSTRIEAMPVKIRSAPPVEDVRRALPEIKPLVSFTPEAAPGVEDVRKLHALAGDAVNAIARRER